MSVQTDKTVNDTVVRKDKKEHYGITNTMLDNLGLSNPDEFIMYNLIEDVNTYIIYYPDFNDTYKINFESKKELEEKIREIVMDETEGVYFR